jgi:hypothetical protein
MTFEDQLRDALRRKEPPPGFAARVASLAASGGAPHESDGRHATPGRALRSRWVAFGMAASLALATASGLVFLDRQKQAEARRARALAIQALRVTSAELGHIQSRVTARVDRSRAERE